MKFNPSFNNRLKEGFLYSTNFPMSQWSTPPSRPLAQGEKAEKESSPKSCVKICRLSYSLFAFGEVDQEGARIGLPSIV